MQCADLDSPPTDGPSTAPVPQHHASRLLSNARIWATWQARVRCTASGCCSWKRRCSGRATASVQWACRCRRSWTGTRQASQSRRCENGCDELDVEMWGHVKAECWPDRLALCKQHLLVDATDALFFVCLAKKMKKLCTAILSMLLIMFPCNASATCFHISVP